jgi:hypothetical protein
MCRTFLPLESLSLELTVYTSLVQLHSKIPRHTAGREILDDMDHICVRIADKLDGPSFSHCQSEADLRIVSQGTAFVLDMSITTSDNKLILHELHPEARNEPQIGEISCSLQ